MTGSSGPGWGRCCEQGERGSASAVVLCWVGGGRREAPLPPPPVPARGCRDWTLAGFLLMPHQAFTGPRWLLQAFLGTQPPLAALPAFQEPKAKPQGSPHHTPFLQAVPCRFCFCLVWWLLFSWLFLHS